ncbi:MAG TPA: hypothetical protein VGO09_05175 [Flavisolibacter sp.]|nr:hypothetical protein [Flavisolibacter sp.]
MTERNKNNTERSSEDNYSGKNSGSQGVDKAPGEEVAGDTKNVVADTQKGKNKVDGDPSLKSDQPIDNE